MNSMLAQFDAEKALMDKAFELVDPAAEAARLLAEGLFTAEQAAAVSWKDPIAAYVSAAELAAAGVTAEQVADAIAFFTATTATVRQVGWTEELSPGYLFTADGYRRGPAGDH